MTKPNPLIADLSTALTNKHYGRALDLMDDLDQQMAPDNFGNDVPFRAFAAVTTRLCMEATEIPLGKLAVLTNKVMFWQPTHRIRPSRVDTPQKEKIKALTKAALVCRLEDAAINQPSLLMGERDLAQDLRFLSPEARAAMRRFVEEVPAVADREDGDNYLMHRLVMLGNLALLGTPAERAACDAALARMMRPEALAVDPPQVVLNVLGRFQSVNYSDPQYYAAHHGSPIPPEWRAVISPAVGQQLHRLASDEAMLADPRAGAKLYLETIDIIDMDRSHAGVHTTYAREQWPAVVACGAALMARAPEDVAQVLDGERHRDCVYRNASNLRKAVTLAVVKDDKNGLPLAERWKLLAMPGAEEFAEYHGPILQFARTAQTTGEKLPWSHGPLLKVLHNGRHEQRVEASGLLLNLLEADVQEVEGKTGERRFIDESSRYSLKEVAQYLPRDMHERFTELCRGRVSGAWAQMIRRESWGPRAASPLLLEALRPAASDHDQDMSATKVTAFVQGQQAEVPEAAFARVHGEMVRLRRIREELPRF